MEHKIVIAETERLILRRYRKEDLPDLFEYLSDREVVEYEPYQPLTLHEAKENLEWRIGTDEMIAIELKSSHKMIGNIYMGKRDFESLELGYVLNKNYWGHGYAAESCKALIEQSFSNGVHRIIRRARSPQRKFMEIARSIGVSARSSFQKERIFLEG